MHRQVPSLDSTLEGQTLQDKLVKDDVTSAGEYGETTRTVWQNFPTDTSRCQEKLGLDRVLTRQNSPL